VAGVAPLAVPLTAPSALPVSDRACLLTIGGISLCPPLIAAGFQATNGGFVILIASVVLLAGLRFFTAPS
jgi:hypothetical protein